MSASSLFVVTPVSNPMHLAGISHAHAVKNTRGAAVFGFRSPEAAFRVAHGIDDRYILNKSPVLSEELLEPFSHLSIGQDVNLKCRPPKNAGLYNVQVGKIDESQVLSYCSALQISAVIFDFSPSGDTLYVKEIISPERSMAFSASYLGYLFDRHDDDSDDIFKYL